jgi:hypothetical protein
MLIVIRGWVKTYYYHIWLKNHPVTIYFRVPKVQGFLTQNHTYIYHKPLSQLSHLQGNLAVWGPYPVTSGKFGCISVHIIIYILGSMNWDII